MASRIPSDTVYYITTTVIDWIDVFTREEYRRVIADSLDYCRRNKELNIHAWVLMTNHLHIIASHPEGKDGLARVMADFKKHTSKEIIRRIADNEQESRKTWMLFRFSEQHLSCNPDASFAVSHSENDSQHYHLWQRGYDAFNLLNVETLRQKLEYVHYNPVKAGFVMEPEEYLYSSARNYYDRPSLFEIDTLHFGPPARAKSHRRI